MYKQLKTYYWILFYVYLILGTGFLSIAIYSFRNGHIFGGILWASVSGVFLKDWWNIYTKRGKIL